MNKNNIGRLFKVAREAQDKTQEEIASGIIARSSLSSFEAGNFVLSDDILMKLAPRLNLNQAFIGGQSSSPFKSKDVIKLFTKEYDTILDPFMGSGTTLIVAKRMRRNSIGIDVVPEYCQMVLQR